MGEMLAAGKVAALCNDKGGCSMVKMFAAGKVAALLTVILQ